MLAWIGWNRNAYIKSKMWAAIPRAFGTVVRSDYSTAKGKKKDHRVMVWIGVFAFGEDFSPCRLRASSTRSTAQMRTPRTLCAEVRNPLFCHKEKKNRPSGDGRGIGVCCSGIVLCVSFRFTCRDCYLPLTTQIRAVRVCEPRALRHCGSRAYSAAKRKKTDHRMMVCFLWQRNRDSNPNIQSQSLLCYLYTIPLNIVQVIHARIF